MDNDKSFNFLYGRRLPSGSLISFMSPHGTSISQMIVQSFWTESSGLTDGTSSSLLRIAKVIVLSSGPYTK